MTLEMSQHIQVDLNDVSNIDGAASDCPLVRHDSDFEAVLPHLTHGIDGIGEQPKLRKSMGRGTFLADCAVSIQKDDFPIVHRAQPFPRRLR